MKLPHWHPLCVEHKKKVKLFLTHSVFSMLTLDLSMLFFPHHISEIFEPAHEPLYRVAGVLAVILVYLE